MTARTKRKRRGSRRRHAESFDPWTGARHTETLCRECDAPIGYCVYPCPCTPLRPDEKHLVADFIRALRG